MRAAPRRAAPPPLTGSRHLASRGRRAQGPPSQFPGWPRWPGVRASPATSAWRSCPLRATAKVCPAAGSPIGQGRATDLQPAGISTEAPSPKTTSATGGVPAARRVRSPPTAVTASPRPTGTCRRSECARLPSRAKPRSHPPAGLSNTPAGSAGSSGGEPAAKAGSAASSTGTTGTAPGWTAAKEPQSGAGTGSSPTTWSRSAPWPADPPGPTQSMPPTSPELCPPTFSGRSSYADPETRFARSGSVAPSGQHNIAVRHSRPPSPERWNIVGWPRPLVPAGTRHLRRPLPGSARRIRAGCSARRRHPIVRSGPGICARCPALPPLCTAPTPSTPTWTTFCRSERCKRLCTA